MLKTVYNRDGLNYVHYYINTIITSPHATKFSSIFPLLFRPLPVNTSDKFYLYQRALYIDVPGVKFYEIIFLKFDPK